MAIFRSSTVMIPRTKDADIGDKVERELVQAIDDAIRRAAKHLPNRLKESFRNMVFEYKDIFRIRLGADPPVDGIRLSVNKSFFYYL